MMMMMKAVVSLLAVVHMLGHLVNADVSDVWCRWNASCLLEANFSIGDDVVIHWIQLPEVQAHSFYHGDDRLENQDKRFGGRTSLFTENIGKGNASLLLKDVLVGDEGRYKCYVGTLIGTSESFINLHIQAPVSKIQFHQADEQQLVCSSDGIFPHPELRWSTQPALPHSLVNSSRAQRATQTQLYNVSGSLHLEGEPDVEYVCDVSSSNSSVRATWRKTAVNISDTETSIDCPLVTQQIRLVWTFNRSHVIARRRVGHRPDVAEEWKKHVKAVSRAGGLDLRELRDNLSGTYTCTLSNATHTRVNHVFLTVTGTEDVRPRVAGIVIGVLAALGSVAVVMVIYLVARRRKRGKRNEPKRPNEEGEENILMPAASHPSEPSAKAQKDERVSRT